MWRLRVLFLNKYKMVSVVCYVQQFSLDTIQCVFLFKSNDWCTHRTYDRTSDARLYVRHVISLLNTLCLFLGSIFGRKRWAWQAKYEIKRVEVWYSRRKVDRPIRISVRLYVNSCVVHIKPIFQFIQ